MFSLCISLYFEALLWNSCPTWAYLSSLGMKHHLSDLLYIFFNIDRQFRFFINLIFLAKPVFFKSLLCRDLVFDPLHCGTFFTTMIKILVNFFALTGIRKVYAFTRHVRIASCARNSRNIHDFCPFFMFLRNYSDVALPVGGRLLCSAPLNGK